MPDLHRLRLLERINNRVDSFIAYLDTDLRYVYNNAQYLRWFGQPTENLRGKHVREVVGEARWNVVKERYQRALAGEASSSITGFTSPETGKDGWGKIDFLPDLDEHGTVLGLFVLVSNVTELKQSERELEQARQQLENKVLERTRALQDREAHLRAITDAVPAGIAFFGRDRKCGFANRTFIEWLDVPPETVVGRAASELLPPEVSASLEISHGGAPWNVEAAFRRNGRARQLELHSVPQELGDPSSGFYLLAYDLTHRQAEEHHHRRMHLRMVESQRMESFGLLARGLAHDFNNSLQAIGGNLELVARTLVPGSPESQFLANAEKSARQAQEFCTELMAYSGRSSNQQAMLDLEDICKEMADFVQSQPDKNCEITLTSNAPLPRVRGNRTQLKQVVLNLLINAVQASSEEPAPIQIALRTRKVAEPLDLRPNSLPAGTYVVCEVVDHGLGMDVVAKERLFEPFFTTKSSGRGLGLAAVLGILRGHEGGIEVDSTPGDGTRVRIYLRALDMRAEIEAKPAEASWSGSGLALVIDDDHAVLEASAEILRQCGFDVFCSSSGEQALPVIEKNHELQLVLLDLLMPGLSGHETFSQIRKLRPQLPIIINSGFPTQAEELLRHERTALLPKPWFPDDLRRTAADLIGQRDSTATKFADDTSTLK